ncbi:hypothetical protein EB118_23480 [bacterium]|nr:hypothetical protein [Micrococcales bacterium]NDG33015.1 hypothetical protein [bacterium]
MIPDNIRLLKLSSSDDILGEVIEETTSTVVINFPLKIVPMPAKNDIGMSMGMMRWDFFMDYDSPIHFNKFTIMAMSPVTDDVKASYCQAFQKYMMMKNMKENDLGDNLDEDIQANDLNLSNRTLH